MRRLQPPPLDEIPDERVYRDLNFPGRGRSVADRPFVAINMVTTLDGKTQLGGRAKGIGSPVDQLMMQHLRSNVDVILNGVGTLRADDVVIRLSPALQEDRIRRGESPQPRYAVVSGSGDLPLQRRVFSQRPPPIVILGQAAPADRVAAARERADVVVLPEEMPTPRSILHVLAEQFGAHRVLLEGGATLNHAFLDQGAVDEIFLTLAPKLVGGLPAKPIVIGEKPFPNVISFDVVSIFANGAEFFLRYVIPPEKAGE